MKILGLLLCFSLIVTSFAKSEDGLPPLIPVDEEISLAESAGPSAIAKGATIYVLERQKGYVLARQGTNGFACFVYRERIDTLEPECFDPEGATSLMKMEMDHARFREEGMTGEQAKAKIDAGFSGGLYRVPRRTTITYMLSNRNKVFNGEKVISYPPHIMISAPYLKNSEIGADFKDPALPWILNEGSPRAYIIAGVAKESVNSVKKEHQH